MHNKYVPVTLCHVLNARPVVERHSNDPLVQFFSKAPFVLGAVVHCGNCSFKHSLRLISAFVDKMLQIST